MKEQDQHIDDSFIRKLPVSGGFEVPDGYFNRSADRLLHTINDDLAVGKEGGYTVPDGYFEQTTQQILQKVKVVEPKKIYLWSWSNVAKVAAVFIAIVGITLFIVIKNKSNQTLSDKLNKVSQDELIDYLANNDVKIEWISEVNYTQTKESTPANTKEIEQYLIDHADEQVLLEEL
ncbi:MAG: hypothetical protein V4620_09045 [Bacteroidota bacterium]